MFLSCFISSLLKNDLIDFRDKTENIPTLILVVAIFLGWILNVVQIGREINNYRYVTKVLTKTIMFFYRVF